MKIIKASSTVVLTHLIIKPDYQLAMDLMNQKLVLKGYSKHTINTYMYMFKQFLRHIHPMPLHHVSTTNLANIKSPLEMLPK